MRAACCCCILQAQARFSPRSARSPSDPPEADERRGGKAQPATWWPRTPRSPSGGGAGFPLPAPPPGGGAAFRRRDASPRVRPRPSGRGCHRRARRSAALAVPQAAAAGASSAESVAERQRSFLECTTGSARRHPVTPDAHGRVPRATSGNPEAGTPPASEPAAMTFDAARTRATARPRLRRPPGRLVGA